SILSSRPNEIASFGNCLRHAKFTTSLWYNSLSSFPTIPKVTKCWRNVCASGGFTLSIPPCCSSHIFHSFAISLALSLIFRVANGLTVPSSGSARTGTSDSKTSTQAHPRSFGDFTGLLSTGKTPETASITNLAGSMQLARATGSSNRRSSTSFLFATTRSKNPLK
ncbi:unnamed protein product, partial [Musa hybrid cultivar]